MPQAAYAYTTKTARRHAAPSIAGLTISDGAMRACAADPIIKAIAERRATRTLAEMASTDRDGDRLGGLVTAIDRRLAKMQPVSRAGALAALELARDEHCFETEAGQSDGRLVAGLLDNAIAFLSREG